MTEQEIIIGNKTIERKITRPVIKAMFFEHLMDVEYELMDETDLRFHSDWNWLMKIVEQIESFNGNANVFTIYKNYVEINDRILYGETSVFFGGSKIEAVWKAVVYWCKIN